MADGQVSVLATAALMPLAMAFTFASALVLPIMALAFAATLVLPAVLFIVAMAVAIIAIAVAGTTAGAGNLPGHRGGNFLIRGGATVFDRHHKILVNGGKHFIQHLARLQKAIAQRVVNHIPAQFVELGDLLLRGRHTVHTLVAQLLAVFVNLAEQIRSIGVLVEKAYAGLGGNNFLVFGEGGGQLRGQFDKLGGKGCICHIGGHSTTSGARLQESILSAHGKVSAGAPGGKTQFTLADPGKKK